MPDNYLVYRGHTFSRIRQGSARGRFSESISLSTLPIDTLSVTVVESGVTQPAPRPMLPLWSGGLLSDRDGKLIAASERYGPEPEAPYIGDLSEYKYGEIVKYYHGGALVVKFYLESIKQVGKWDWKFNCISPIGVLNTSDHYGGIYQGVKLGVVLADIINGIIPYTIDESLSNKKVYQWLPKSSRRNNLRDLLFSANATIGYNNNGDLHFFEYDFPETQKPITASSFYMGGSVANGTPATQAIVVEHNFVARDIDPEETLFDGEAVGTTIITPQGTSVNGVLVEFKSPMHDLVCTGANILESNPNYAVISSTGYAHLVGKSYTHTERQVVADSTNKEGSSPNVVRSSQCTLVNIRNSKIALERVMAFYGYAYKVQVDILLFTEKCGDYVSFTDPYGGKRVGYIESMDVVYSKEAKASCTIICGFIPPHDIPMYLHSETFTSNTTWTVPEGVTSVRVVCISGGSGGQAGQKGGDGMSDGVKYSGSNIDSENDVVYYAGKTGGSTGVPGKSGTPGNGGKIYSTNILVTPGQKFQVRIGSGGTGGAQNSAYGAAGGNTTFGPISSASGSISPTGYVEELTNKTYASTGPNGMDGAKGASSKRSSSDIRTSIPGDDLVYQGVTYKPGEYNGTSVEIQDRFNWVNKEYTIYLKAYGGGPAAGSFGNSYTVDSSNKFKIKGGNGATPVAALNGVIRGDGGQGGHGGGSGRGAAGWETGGLDSSTVNSTNISREGGTGGNGGKGGDGAPGICFIYYYSPEEV